MKENLSILLVEDDLVDQMTVKRAFKDLQITNRLDITGNGLEALELLRSGAALPCIILLDLNMPKMNGIEFLRELRKDEKLIGLPVVVFTTSNEDSGRIESLKLNVAGYIIKPLDYDRFVEVIRTIYNYWT
ncbi:MAG: response regulator [Deltaproteobacteria bacterium]|nr:response regulator [Deltaproteobacteria bacterium]